MGCTRAVALHVIVFVNLELRRRARAGWGILA